ncbi:response regulator transcription factor [Anaeromassilibacillus senegalensis]|uniref:response regulator transcription factor n=1 Tax=Anaeromassilibacillus senegalensis TaxID=1673717 RepID=UPI000681B706|nr:response regulator [Anaeromassilibacillus senegalensis]
MLHMLIADDEREEREGIQFLLDKYHFEVVTAHAANGKAALEYLREHPVDILFTDVRMPFMDGLALSREGLRLQPKMRVILFSGFSEFEYAQTALSLGVSHYILKPIRIEEFCSVMEQVVQEIQKTRAEEERSLRQLAYVREHLLYSLVNGIPMEALAAKAGAFFDLSFLEAYHKILLLEFQRDFFEHAGVSFKKEFLSRMDVSADYINLNPRQSLLLFPGDVSQTNWRQLAQNLYDFVQQSSDKVCYIAVSSTFSGAGKISQVLDQLDQLIENRFLIPHTYLFFQESLAEDIPAVRPDETESQDSGTGFTSKELHPGSTPHSYVETVKNYIREHYKEELDLENLSNMVYLTPRYLSHIFKKETGYGINKYIKAMRMEKAKELLENTHMKIVSICTAVGYSNVSYFIQSFREYFGKSPEKFRKKDA